MSVNNYPEYAEVEITVLGTGGGYGECIVIHLGASNWIVIDCCMSPDMNENLPIAYLTSIGVNLETEVKGIICTHWHDDHIRGIAELYATCKAARMNFSPAHDFKKFLQFVSLDFEKAKNGASASSTLEFFKVYDVLKSRKDCFVRVHSDRLLYKYCIEDKDVRVYALSPSDQTLDHFDLELSSLITDFGKSNKRIVIEKPNAKSVALYVKFGLRSAILGSDLEVGHEVNSGWLNILDNVHCIDRENKSCYFKIPHHGSENGYSIRIWQEMLTDSPIGTITPWNRKEGLPSEDMIIKYSNHSPNIYITSPPKYSSKPKKRDHKLTKLIKDSNIKIFEQKFTKGIIRARVSLQDENTSWDISVFEAAHKILPPISS